MAPMTPIEVCYSLYPMSSVEDADFPDSFEACGWILLGWLNLHDQVH